MQVLLLLLVQRIRRKELTPPEAFPAATPLCRAPRKALPAGACADAPQNSSTAIAAQQHAAARLCAI